MCWALIQCWTICIVAMLCFVQFCLRKISIRICFVNKYLTKIFRNQINKPTLKSLDKDIFQCFWIFLHAYKTDFHIQCKGLYLGKRKICIFLLSPSLFRRIIDITCVGRPFSIEGPSEFYCQIEQPSYWLFMLPLFLAYKRLLSYTTPIFY